MPLLLLLSPISLSSLVNKILLTLQTLLQLISRTLVSSLSFTVFANEGTDDSVDVVDEDVKLKFFKFDDDTIKVNADFFGDACDDDDDNGDEVISEDVKQVSLFPVKQDESE